LCILTKDYSKNFTTMCLLTIDLMATQVVKSIVIQINVRLMDLSIKRLSLIPFQASLCWFYWFWCQQTLLCMEVEKTQDWDNTVSCRIDTNLIWNLPIQYIWYTCTWLKVSKSRILDFNNKVNGLGWSIWRIQ